LARFDFKVELRQMNDELSTKEKRLSANKAWKEKNKQRILDYNKKYNAKRASDPIRWALKLKQDSESRKRNRQKLKEYDKARDKSKAYARNVLRNAVRNGKIIRFACSVCGNPKTHAHHEDYSKPLEVIFLCAKHHKQLHENTKN